MTANEKQEGFPRETTMDVLIRMYPSVIPVMHRHGLYCVGCLLAPFHDVRDAAVEHEVDEDILYRELVIAANGPA
jgi:hybrid cluster-associated redox disulfide protein